MNQPNDVPTYPTELPKWREKGAVEQTEEEKEATKAAQRAHTEAMNNPDVSGQKPRTDQVPAHLAPQMHAPYDAKPMVQVQNEALTNESPTGYKPHSPCLNLDQAQLDSIQDHNTDAYREAKNRVDSAPKTESDECEAQGSGYTHGWDMGFSQDGDPYGIQSEYLTQSANPDAAIPSDWPTDANGQYVGTLPTQADADRVAAEAAAEEQARHDQAA